MDGTESHTCWLRRTLRVEGPSEGLITGEDSVLPFDLKSEDIPMEARYAQELSTGAS